MFISAEIIPNGYTTESDANGVETAILITGKITDDTLGEWFGTYTIDGATLAALPASNPDTDGKPSDPRFQAIMALVAQFVKSSHAKWVAAASATPSRTPKAADEIEALPTLTPELLGILAP